jgi:hypothetical protein
MPIYVSPPVFTDNTGQLVSHEDLQVLRQNVGYAELLSYRMMPGFPSSGGLETFTPGYYPANADITIWFGAVRFRSGMTTLAIQGTAANWGSMSFKVYVNGTLRITVSPASSWSGTWTMSGFTDGQVLDVQVVADYSSGGAGPTTKFVVTAVYATPIVPGTTWPGVPTFTTAWTAAKLNQLVAASEWVYNRATAAPIRPDLACLYNLSSFKGDNRPIYFGSVGRWFSNSEFAFSGQVFNGGSPGLYLEIRFNGTLVYTSANMAIGTTNVFFTLSLAGYAIGEQIEVGVWMNNTIAGAQADWTFSRLTMNAVRSQVDTSATYSSITATPLEDITTSPATMAAYLNDLSAVVLAAYNRMVAAPEVFNRTWGLRRFFSKYNKFSDINQKRGRPRFIRTGHRLIVRGKGVSIGYGPISVPLDERGQGWEDYKFLHNQSVIDGDKEQTQVVYLDTLPGLTYGTPYYILGDVTWAEESII